MSTGLYIALSAYFGANLYITGRYAENVIDERRWRVLVFHIVAILFALPIHAAAATYGALEQLFTLFQIKTLWQLYVQGKHRDYPPDKLEYLNKYCDKSDTFRGRMFRFVVRLVNKANNYTPAQ